MIQTFAVALAAAMLADDFAIAEPEQRVNVGPYRVTLSAGLARGPFATSVSTAY